MRCRPPPSQIFKDRGIEVDFQPDLGKDKEKLAEVIGGFDGLAIRSATKVTAKILEKAEEPEGDRPRRHRRRQCRHPGRDRAGHHRDEHAVRQFDHDRRARHHADAGAGAPDSRGRCLDPGRQMGKEQVSWASRSPARRSASSAAAISARSSPIARIGLKMKVIAYDPFLSAERALELGVEKVELAELFRARRFHHAAYAADRQDPQHPRRRGDRR